MPTEDSAVATPLQSARSVWRQRSTLGAMMKSMGVAICTERVEAKLTLIVVQHPAGTVAICTERVEAKFFGDRRLILSIPLQSARSVWRQSSSTMEKSATEKVAICTERVEAKDCIYLPFTLAGVAICTGCVESSAVSLYEKSEKIYADLLHFYSSWCIIHLVRQTDTKMMKIRMKIKESIVMAKMRVLLAYSGGLDTSIIVPWLKENYDCDVVCVAGDVGQGEELEPLHEKAQKCGAEKLYIEDLRKEFVEDFIWPTLKAGAVYEGKYLLGTSFARPLIAKRLVEIAHKEKCTAICHGCTGKGNDQVRFELTIKAFDPNMQIIAPWRIWDIKTREEEIDYAEKRGIPVPVKKDRPYSMDRNIWHISHEGADLEDPWNEPPEDLLLTMVTPEKAPDQPEYVTVDFEQGVPVAINGEKLDAVDLLTKANEIAGRNGVGCADLVENRLVGMKSRGVYETPGGTMLYAAHGILESITLDRATSHYKELVASKFAELVYDGMWYTPLREALSAFVDSTQQAVNGTVKLKLYKGNCINAGVKSPNSLYMEEIATFGDSHDLYSHKDSAGFINLLGLPLKVKAMVEQKNKK